MFLLFVFSNLRHYDWNNPGSVFLTYSFSILHQLKKFISVFGFSRMKIAMARTTSSNESSKRHFHWTEKVGNEEGLEAPTLKSSSEVAEKEKEEDDRPQPQVLLQGQRIKLQQIAVSRLKSVLSVFGKNRGNLPLGLGPRVVGTLFGSRRGYVHFAFQKDPTAHPALLIELATPISGLVKEMASGLVRIALECDKSKEDEKKPVRLLEEPAWRTFCNGKKCGFAARRDCGPKDWKILKALEPISTGAGVLPGTAGEAGSNGDFMYMRAKFERIVGSKDSEAFYMMNPDSNGAPELSIYLLRL